MRDLIPWNRSRNLAREDEFFAPFRRDIDRMFDDLWRSFEGRSFLPAAGASGGGWPSVDVDETDQGYTVTVEVPGLDEKEVELTLRDNTLIISGEKRQEREDNNGGRHYAERVYGRFERSLPFPMEIDADRVTASAKNGVLSISLPKNPQARDKTRKIPIGAGKTANV